MSQSGKPPRVAPHRQKRHQAFTLKVQRLIADTPTRIWTNGINHEKFPFVQSYCDFCINGMNSRRSFGGVTSSAITSLKDSMG
jgi:hypothetical protein